MQRILFLLLSFIPLFSQPSWSGIEIEANGRHYSSLQAYLNAGRSADKASTVIISDGKSRRLYAMSVEQGVLGALEDFHHLHKRSFFHRSPTITSEQLQEAIERTVSSSKYPILLISQPGKVRIMSLAGQDLTSAE